MPPGCGREPGRGQDPADRSRADAVPEAEELALDAPVSPPRVLPDQLLDQLTDLLRDRRASGGVWVGPLVLYQAPVPGEQGAGRDDPVRPTGPVPTPFPGAAHLPLPPL